MNLITNKTYFPFRVLRACVVGRFSIYFLISCAFLFQNCAPSRFVKPLAKKEKALSASFGGPIISFSGAAIPMPFTTIAGAYGITDHTTAYASLHTTSLLFGNLQSDIGSTILLLHKENSYGLTLSPALQLASSFNAKGTFRCWPSLDLNWYKHYAQRASYMYAGLSCWIEPSITRSHALRQTQNLLPNIQLGYVFVRTRWNHQLECRYLGLGIPNRPNVVEYVGIGGKGALGLYYAIVRKF